MWKKMLVLAVITVFLVIMKAGDSIAFRCGSGLVRAGDSKTKVLVECGNPTYKEFGKAKRRIDGASGVSSARSHNMPLVEKWYYNCGDYDFIYVLEFENNILRSEDTIERGKGKSDCKGAAARTE
jgi:hypothetical protein